MTSILRILSLVAVALLVCGPTKAGADEPIELFDEASDGASETDDDSEDGSETTSSTSSESSIDIERGGGGAASDGFVPGRAPGHVELEFERRGQAILVPAEVSGTSVYFVLDTGASLVSLTPRVARDAGVLPPDDAPSLTLQTANGTTRSPVGLIDRLRLGRRSHEHVTYALCSGCGDETHRGKPVAGLLGLNVLRRYETDIDHQNGIVTLDEDAHFSGRLHDVQPWIEVRDVFVTSGGKNSDEGEVRFEVVNHAPRRVGAADFAVHCPGAERGDGSIELSLEAGETITTKSEVGELACRRPRVELVEASWY